MANDVEQAKIEIADFQINTGEEYSVLCPFPVGYIYMSLDPTSPSSIFGGT